MVIRLPLVASLIVAGCAQLAPPGDTSTPTAVIRDFRLESGVVMPEVRIAYETYGTLAPSGRNAILVAHGNTSTHHAQVWWSGLIGPGKAIDTRRYFVVSSNLLGGTYGSTGPRSIDPRTGKPYGPTFPEVTLVDMVRAQHALLEQIGVKHLVAVAGPSFGGFVAFQWGVTYPDMVDGVVAVVTSPRGGHNPQRVKDVEGQLARDPNWNGGWYYDKGGIKGTLTDLRVATLKAYGIENAIAAEFPDPAAREAEIRRRAAPWAETFDGNTLIVQRRASEFRDAEKDFPRMKAKVLYVLSTTDRLFPPSIAPVVMAKLKRPASMRPTWSWKAKRGTAPAPRTRRSTRRRCGLSSSACRRPEALLHLRDFVLDGSRRPVGFSSFARRSAGMSSIVFGTAGWALPSAGRQHLGHRLLVAKRIARLGDPLRRHRNVVALVVGHHADDPALHVEQRRAGNAPRARLIDLHVALRLEGDVLELGLRELHLALGIHLRGIHEVAHLGGGRELEGARADAFRVEAAQPERRIDDRHLRRDLARRDVHDDLRARRERPARGHEHAVGDREGDADRQRAARDLDAVHAPDRGGHVGEDLLRGARLEHGIRRGLGEQEIAARGRDADSADDDRARARAPAPVGLDQRCVVALAAGRVGEVAGTPREAASRA
jgi:homoserine O-acetyltransferase